MIRAFVCIEADLAAEKDILQKLKKIEGVKKVYALYEGPYNIIAKVSALNKSVLDEIVFGKIRKIETIEATVTLIVTKS